MFRTNKRVLITGGVGFIGFHLANSLLDDGWEVVTLDNYNDYYDVELKYARSSLLAERGAFLYNGDIRDIDTIDNVMEHTKPRMVIHLAACVGVRHSMTHAKDYHDVNIQGTQNLIEMAEKHMVARIVYASTSCVAAGQSLPWKEDEPIRHQLNPYGYTKYVNECQFKMQNIHAVGLRFFTVYGPYGRPDMALFGWTNDLLNGRPLPVFNNGDMFRDWTYVDDIVAGIRTIIDKGEEIPHGEVFNIGCGRPTNLLDFISELAKNIGVDDYELNRLPRHPADTLGTYADTSKIERLGWKSTTPVQDGIPKFWEWYRSHYGI